MKIFEIDFVIEIKWYLTFWPLPRAPGGGAKKKFDVARPIHVSNSHTKFGWISSNGLGVDSITDRQTDGGDYNIPFAFLKKRGDNKLCIILGWDEETSKTHVMEDRPKLMELESR